MTLGTDLVYQGEELALFAHARNWKAYWSTFLLDYLHGSVLEVGAGIGTNTVLLSRAQPARWVCLEPDGKECDRRLQRRAVPARPSLGQIREWTRSHRRPRPGHAFTAMRRSMVANPSVLRHASSVSRHRSGLGPATK